VSEDTVKSQVRSILQKLGTESLGESAAMVLRELAER